MNIEPGEYDDLREGGRFYTDGEVVMGDIGNPLVVFYNIQEEDEEFARELVDATRLRYMKRVEAGPVLETVPYTPEIVPTNAKELYIHACKIPDTTVILDESLVTFKNSIKLGVFTNRFSVYDDQLCIRDKNYMAEMTDKLFKFGEMVKPFPNKGQDMFFYRGIRASESYDPSKWEEGERFAQVIPFSTSVVPEFSLEWSGYSCCLFKINVKVDENFFFLCADNLINPPPGSQFEATLPPGEFTVRKKVMIIYKDARKTFIEMDFKAWSHSKWESEFEDTPSC